MFIRDKDKPMAARLLMLVSLAAAVFAGIGAFFQDVFLASTQWLLVATLTAIWAVFMLLEAEFRSN